MKKKSLAAKILACTLAASMLAGCGAPAGKSENDAKTADTAAEKAADTTVKQADRPEGEKLELTLFLFDLMPFKDDWPVYKKAEEMTNIAIKGVLSQSTSDGNSALNLMLSSGNLADIIHTNGRNNFYKYGVDGVLIPLNDYIESDAPNIKKLLDEKPEIKKFITAPDGNIYFIPFMADGVASKGWFIRQDWLDKLGLEVPDNIDELHTVLKAFKEQDPNGNGKQDEVPYFNRDAAVGREMGITDLLSFWNVNKSFMLKDGKVVYAPMLPEFKEAMKTVSQWYAEGLIDNEIYTRGNNAREYMLGNDIGGMTHDWFASTADYNDKLHDQYPEMNLVPFVPIEGVDGVRREMDSRDKVNDYGWGISSTNQYPKETMQWMDFWFSEEGSRLMNFGIEGEDYDMVDGKPIFKDSVLHGEQSVANYLKDRGGQGNVGFQQDFEYERQWTNPIALKGIDEYINGGYFQTKFPPLVLDVDAQSEYDAIIKDVETLRDETMQKWVLGNEDVEEGYDEFIDNLKKMKVDRLIELEQAAYDKYVSE